VKIRIAVSIDASAAMPVFFNRKDLLYINSELTGLSIEESEQQDKIIKDIDYSTTNIDVSYDDNADDIIIQDTKHSVPTVRGSLFGINDLDKNDRI